MTLLEKYKELLISSVEYKRLSELKRKRGYLTFDEEKVLYKAKKLIDKHAAVLEEENKIKERVKQLEIG